MLKLLPVIALLACLPFCWQPLRGQTPSERVTANHHKKQQPRLANDNSKNTQIGTKDFPLTVDTEGHKKTPAEAAEDKRKSDESDRIASGTFGLARLNALFAGILILVGLGGVCAAVRTLWAIESQVRLMEAPYRQWVQLQNWKVKPDPYGTWRLLVWVDIENPTPFPLTVKEGFIVFGTTPETTLFRLGENCFLPPKTPYTIEAVIQITDLEYAAFDRGDRIFPQACGSFSHTGTLAGKATTQSFKGVLECSQSGVATFSYDVHMTPEPEQAEKRQNPN